MPELSPTTCFDCGRSHPPDRKRCDCGQPVWFDATPGAEALVADRDGPPGIWRRAGALPVPAPPDPRADLGAATGTTPLVRVPALDGAVAPDGAGPDVWVKDETANPTGTFKDRGTAVAVHGIGARAGGDADPAIGTVSHGNMAISTAAFAAASGLSAVVLVPADVPAERLAAIAQYGPTIRRVEGDYGRLYYEALALDVGTTGVDFVASDTPLRVAGQKTVAHETCAQFPRGDPFGAPDAVVLPVSSGGHASAVWKGLRELVAAGLIAEPPRIYLAQAAACAPIARAYRRGGAVEPVEPGETVAYSIANPDPPSGDRALAAVRATGGGVVAVDDPATERARETLARRAGTCVEAGSAVALAGLREFVREGAIGGDEEVVLVATGTGFRELAAGGVEAPVVELADLGAAVGGAAASGE